ncbi:MAG: STAS domain-containing protein [Solirubrobacteraceae bacterium]
MTAVEVLDRAPAWFGVGVEPAREVVRVQPVGELDLAAVSVLGDQVSELLEVGFDRLVIDLGGLSFIDVAGLRLLLGLALRARGEGWRLSLVPGADRVQRLFALTGTLDGLPFSSFGEVGVKHGQDHPAARQAPWDRSSVRGDRGGSRPRAGVGQR